MGVYPYEYMDNWEKFSETTLPEKEDFYTHLSMEDINVADYTHGKRACKGFETNNLREYHDLFVQSDTKMLAGVFENFRNLCLEVYQLHPAPFFSAPR